MNKLIIATLLTCMGFCRSASCQTDGETYYNKGVAEMADSSFQQALTDLNQAIAAYKSDKKKLAPVYVCRAEVQIKLKDYKDAINDCNTALEKDDKLYDAYWCRGEAEMKNEDFQLAISDETEAAQYFRNDKPNLCKAYLTLAKSEIGSKNFSDAIEHCNDITAIDSTFREAYYTKAIADKSIDDNSNVITDCSKAIPYYKNDAATSATLYCNRAVAECNLNDYKNSAADDSMALTYNPKLSNAYWNRGYDREKLEQYKSSLADYTKALPFYKDENKKMCDLYFNIGRVQSDLFDSKSAIDAYDSVLAISPHNRDAFWYRGSVYKKCEQYQMAINDYNKAILYYDVDKESASKLYNLKAQCEEDLKHYEKAVTDDSIAIVLNDKNGYAYWTMGFCYQKLEQHKSAIKTTTTAMKYFTKDTSSLKVLYVNRGNDYTYSGNYVKGISDFNYALTLDAKYGRAFWALAYAYEDSGAFEQAIATYTKTMTFYDGDYVNIASLYKEIGFCNGRLKQYQKSIEDETKAISLDTSDAGYAYFERGRNYLQLNDKTHALSDFKKSMKLDTSGATYAFDVFFSGDTAGGVKIMKHILATSVAEHKNLHADDYNLSCFMSLMNKPDEALSYLKKAIAEGQSKKFANYDPDFENIRSNPEFGKLVE